MTADAGLSLAGVEAPALSSMLVGALGAGDAASTVSEVASPAIAVVMMGSEGRLLVGGREDSSSPALAAEEPSGTKGNDERSSAGMGRGVMPGRLRGGKAGRGGKPRMEMAQVTRPRSTRRAVLTQPEEYPCFIKDTDAKDSTQIITFAPLRPGATTVKYLSL